MKVSLFIRATLDDDKFLIESQNVHFVPEYCIMINGLRSTSGVIYITNFFWKRD